MSTRIMYIERKAGELTGPARIGRVTFSKSGKTLHYGGRKFRSLRGKGFKANYYEVETKEEYWISGCRGDGQDRLYGERLPVFIDDDVREEYWTRIRKVPKNKLKKLANRRAAAAEPASRPPRYNADKSDIPLSAAQVALRGRSVINMTDAQLALWLDACQKMERRVKPNKARRSWTADRLEAEAEIARRREKLGIEQPAKES